MLPYILNIIENDSLRKLTLHHFRGRVDDIYFLFHLSVVIYNSYVNVNAMGAWDWDE